MEHIDGVGVARWARGPSRNERTTSLMPVTRAEIDLDATTRKLAHPPRLDDGEFDEDARLDDATREGSRSGCFILHLAIGLARFYLGDRRDASDHFEQARSFLDAAPSTWHIPILHQHAALAACATDRKSVV